MNYSHEEMVEEVLKWFARSDTEEQIAFVSTEIDNLVQYHTTLGRQIRNEFEMWRDEHEPFIVDGCDHSQDHPDARSMRVMEDVWRRLNSIEVKA